MIHSLSGGVIKDGGSHTFVKVKDVETGNVFWLLCDEFRVEEKDVVVYEDKKGWLKRAVVISCQRGVSSQTPPVPINRIGVVMKVEK